MVVKFPIGASKSLNKQIQSVKQNPTDLSEYILKNSQKSFGLD